MCVKLALIYILFQSDSRIDASTIFVKANCSLYKIKYTHFIGRVINNMMNISYI